MAVVFFVSGRFQTIGIVQQRQISGFPTLRPRMHTLRILQSILACRCRLEVTRFLWSQFVRIQLLTILFITSVVHALPAAQIDKSKSSEDSNGWKKTADSFMDNLVANRIDEAVDLMEPAFVKAIGSRDSAKSALVHLFDYCGRPLDSQFQHEERGYKQYPDGRRKEMRKFFYDAATDQYAKGVCFFAIDIVPGDTGSGGYRVTTFGPLKRLGGR